MKVAFVSYDFGQYCVRLASELVEHCEVLLVLNTKVAGEHLSELDPAVELHAFRAPRLRQALRQIRTTCQLGRAIARFAPDVIHFQRGHLWFNLALPFLKRYPLVLTVHDVLHHPGDKGSQKTPQAIMDFGYRRADRLIVHGQRLKQILVDEEGIAADVIDVTPHVAIGSKSPPPASVEKERQILFFGRIWDYKGLEYLIRAEPMITAQVPDAKIVIAGQGEAFDRYRRMMVHPDRFVVHNQWISDQRRAELFQEASVVALPYTEASQSGVIPVAYSYGKPVVATDTGALAEAVDNGVTGYLVAPRAEAPLADALVRLLRDAELRRQMGEAGRRKLDTESSPAVVAAKTLDVYRRAIDQRSSRPRRPKA